MQLNNTLGCCLAEVVNALVDSGYVETSASTSIRIASLKIHRRWKGGLEG